MAFLYVDSDGSGASAPYGTWATAAQDLITAAAAASAGDIIYVQGAAADTAASSRAVSGSGVRNNPIIVIGVKDGTTNTGTSVTASDLLVRGTDTLYLFQATGAGNDITFSGSFYFHGIKFDAVDRIDPKGADLVTSNFHQCEFLCGGAMWFTGAETVIRCIDCEMLGDHFRLQSSGTKVIWQGGEINTTNASYIILNNNVDMLIEGADLSGATATAIHSGAGNGRTIIKNCKLKASWTMGGAHGSAAGFFKFIGCNTGTSKSNTGSYQDYDYSDDFGTITLETTAVRTGGADDGADGGFSYAMTPLANATKESSESLESPTLAVWVPGGASKTLTVYIANSTASTDYNEDEVWCEFFTPDAGDTAQHDHTFDPALPRLVDSSTAVTDDTGSTWGTGANNHQKFSVTTTPGFEGWAYARVYLAKRQATPDTLYLDPKIAVT